MKDDIVAQTILTFCARYGCARSRAFEEIRAGRLRAIRVGRRTLIRESDAQEWLATHGQPIRPRRLHTNTDEAFATHTREGEAA